LEMQSMNPQLEEKIRRLEEERDAALARVRDLEKDQHTRSARMEHTDRERPRSLADSIPHMVWAAQPDGFIFYYNRRIWVETLHPDDRQRVVTAWEKSLRSGDEYRIEFRVFNDGTGEYRWFQAHAMPQCDEDGRIVQWYGTCTDIQDRKNAEQQLQESEERFREAFANVPVGMVIVSLDGRFQHVNPAYCRLVGYSREELLNPDFDFKRLIHPDDQWAAGSEIDRMLSGETPAIFIENRYLRQNGSTVWVRVSGSVRRSDEGRPFQIVGIVEDISDRKRAEAERERLLAEIEKRAKELEAIIHSMAEGVTIYNSQGEIVRINPAAEQITGFRPEDFSVSLADRWGKVRIETPEGQPIPYAMDPAFRALQGETVRGDTMVLHLASDRTVWASVSAAPIRIGKEIFGAVATFTDVTRVRQIQQEREAFLHTITHDLRGPLTVILGHAELLQAELDSADLGEMPDTNVRSILSAGEQMVRMIDDLVDLAHLEGGNLKLDREPVELSAFFADYMKRAQVAMDVSRIEINVAPNLRPAWADPRNLERILGNLLGNALKYSEDSVTVAMQSAAGEEIVVSVADKGPGIPPEEVPRIFDRFFRVEGTKGEGLGLGLYITRTLVEAQSGRLWVDSRPGEGSTFSFTLPLAQPTLSICRGDAAADRDKTRRKKEAALIS
jgi:PAS domain S-box-containing protein